MSEAAPRRLSRRSLRPRDHGKRRRGNRAVALLALATLARWSTTRVPSSSASGQISGPARADARSRSSMPASARPRDTRRGRCPSAASSSPRMTGLPAWCSSFPTPPPRTRFARSCTVWSRRRTASSRPWARHGRDARITSIRSLSAPGRHDRLGMPGDPPARCPLRRPQSLRAVVARASQDGRGERRSDPEGLVALTVRPRDGGRRRTAPRVRRARPRRRA